MNKTSKSRTIFSWGSLALATSLLVSLLAPAAQANTYSAPNAPTNVTSYLSSRGVVVKWTPGAAVEPGVTGHVVSAGPGSCPIFVPVGNRSIITMPVVEGQPAGTPVVQAVNAYGFSKPAASSKSYTAAQLATVALTTNKAVQVLQLSDLHGAIEGTSFGAALLTSNWAADRTANTATVSISAGDNIGAAPPISTEFEELPTIEALNLAKLDVSVFGNHEHDRNLDHVKKIIGASDFQWVVSNYSEGALDVLKSGTKQAKNYTIIERGGLKIGIVGSNTSETIEQVFPGNLDYKDASGSTKTIVINPGVAGINAAITEAKAAGADIVIAALHQGWTENSGGVAKGLFNELASEIKGAAAIYGGHSHQTYASVIKKNAGVAPVVLGQVRNAGVEYTRTQICLRNGKVVGQSIQHVLRAASATINTSVAATTTTADVATAAMVKKYKDQLSAKLDVKIGQVSGVFPRGG